MPTHAAPLPVNKLSSPSAASSSTSDTTSKAVADAATASSQDQSYFANLESLQTVPEEPDSNESSRVLPEPTDNGASVDVLSPRSVGVAPSVATLEAEIAGRATGEGKPLFDEPDFGPGGFDEEGSGPGPVVDDVEPPTGPAALRRSPGSFSAQGARDGEMVSPTER